jgi:hypothetical protein
VRSPRASRKLGPAGLPRISEVDLSVLPSFSRLGGANQPSRLANPSSEDSAAQLTPADATTGEFPGWDATATAVHADVSGGDAAMRDAERFHFGFTVPFIPHNGPAGVIDAVARSSGDLGMFPVEGGAAAGAWWTKLIEPAAPKIIARLPFVERASHPAGMPVFVIAKPLQDAAAREEVLYCLHMERYWDGLPANVEKIGGEVIGKVADEIGLALLLTVPKNVHPDEIRNALHDGNVLGGRIDEVGCHALRFKL